jgi:acetyltransferase-like isoleucine patch superfamily enzyme
VPIDTGVGVGGISVAVGNGVFVGFGVAVLVGKGVFVEAGVLVDTGVAIAPIDPVPQAKTNSAVSNKTNKTFVKELLCFMIFSPFAK